MTVRKIWVLTSGGDAPGMNAAIRAVTRTAIAAADLLSHGKSGVLVGLIQGEIIATPLSEVAGKKKPLDLRLLDLAQVLAQ